ncbi:unnamed protein product, partial [Vitis vinifera]
MTSHRCRPFQRPPLSLRPPSSTSENLPFSGTRVPMDEVQAWWEVALKCLDGLGQNQKSFLREVKTTGSIHQTHRRRRFDIERSKWHCSLVNEYVCLIPGQTLVSGQKMIASVSEKNWSEGFLSFYATSEGIAACVGTTPPLAYFFMRVGNTGSINLKETTSFSFAPELDASTDIESCKRACLKNYSCKAAVFLTAADNRLCYLPSEIFSLMNIEVYSTLLNSTTFLKVQNISVILLLSLEAFLCLFLAVMACYFLSLGFKDAKEDEEDYLHQVPGMPTRFSHEILVNSEDMQAHGAEVVEMMRLAAWCLQGEVTKRPSMSVVVKVLEGVINVEGNLEYNFFYPAVGHALEVSSLLSIQQFSVRLLSLLFLIHFGGLLGLSILILVLLDSYRTRFFRKQIETKVVWSANRNIPVQANATVQLTQGGDLILREVDGTLNKIQHKILSQILMMTILQPSHHSSPELRVPENFQQLGMSS